MHVAGEAAQRSLMDGREWPSREVSGPNQAVLPQGRHISASWRVPTGNSKARPEGTGRALVSDVIERIDDDVEFSYKHQEARSARADGAPKGTSLGSWRFSWRSWCWSSFGGWSSSCCRRWSRGMRSAGTAVASVSAAGRLTAGWFTAGRLWLEALQLWQLDLRALQCWKLRWLAAAVMMAGFGRRHQAENQGTGNNTHYQSLQHRQLRGCFVRVITSVTIDA